jgi:hypothetical protein
LKSIKKAAGNKRIKSKDYVVNKTKTTLNRGLKEMGGRVVGMTTNPNPPRLHLSPFKPLKLEAWLWMI